MDDDLTDMVRNNPPDVVFSAFSEAFFKGAIKMFQRDNEMRSIVLSDAQARDQATGISSIGRYGKLERRHRDNVVPCLSG